MSHPFNLSLIRHNDILAGCWLAASSEKLLKKYYNHNAIQNINVAEACDEIMENMQSNDGRSYKFSLRQLSQLMHGVTKIFQKQVEQCDKDIMASCKILYPTLPVDTNNRSLENSFTNLQILCSDIINYPLEKDLHLLPGQDIDRLQALRNIEADLDFGVLADEDLKAFLNDESLLQPKRKANAEVTDFLEMADTEIPDVEIAEDSHRDKQSSQDRTTLLVDVRMRGSILTPQKRLSHHPHIETPTKRRRLPLEEAAAPVEAEMEESVLPQQANIEIESLQLNFEEIDLGKPKKKPMKLQIDKRTTVPSKFFINWPHKTHIHTRKLERPLINNVSLKSLFKQSAKRWGAGLQKLFHDHITGPFTSATESTFVQVPEVRRTIAPHAEQSSVFLNHRIADGSTMLFVSTMQSIPMANNVTNQTEQTSVKAGHMNILEENIDIAEPRQDEEIINDMSYDERVQLTSDKIFEMVEQETLHSEFITFEQLIPKDKYMKIDVTFAFFSLLELHAQKKIILQQESMLASLWIRKVEYFD